MNTLQIKSLKHASEILKEHDIYPIYSEISKALKTAEVSDSNSKEILNILQKESNKLRRIAEKADEWIGSVILSIEQK